MNGSFRKILDLQTCLYIAGVAVLVAGLGSSIAIYRTAENGVRGALGYEQGYDSVYPVMPEDSKLYQRGLELYGGKAEMLVDASRRWFAGLWHGKTLAWTVAFLAILISAAMFYTAWRMPRRETDAEGEDNGDGPGAE